MKKNIPSTGICFAAFLITIFISSAETRADESRRAVVLEEVVVTAQRKEQSLQSVPLAVTAYTAEALKNNRVTDSLALGEIAPNVEIKSFGGSPNVFIRGLGNNDFNASTISPVTIYRDEVPLSSTASQNFALLDLASVQVLRGPQGTLFGKNTIAGAILFESRLPENELEGYIDMGVGRFNLQEVEAAVSLPLNDKLSVRLAGLSRTRDGSRKNVTTGEDVDTLEEQAFRATTRFIASDELEFRLIAGLNKNRSDYPPGKQVGYFDGADLLGFVDPTPDDPRKVYSGGENFTESVGSSRNHRDNHYASLTVIWDLSDNYQFKSITGYDSSELEVATDGDNSPGDLNHSLFMADVEQFSQELQLSYTGGDLQWLAGVFMLREELESNTESDSVGVFQPDGGDFPFLTFAARQNDSYAIFAQGTYDVTERLRATLGIRYTRDEVDAEHRAVLAPGYFFPDIPDGPRSTLVPHAEFSDSWDAISGRAALEFDVSDQTMAYGSVTRGFKAGGFNIGVVTSEIERGKLDPEYLTAYEFGLKSDLFSERLRVNTSIFHYDYKDLQVPSLNVQSGSLVPTLIVENAATATVNGLEIEYQWLLHQNVELSGNIAWLDAQYDDYASGAIDPVTNEPRDFSGNTLPGSPELSGQIALTFFTALPGDLEGRATLDYVYTDNKFYNNAEDPRVSSHGSYAVMNARYSVSSLNGRWQVSAWVRNLQDEEYVVHSIDILAQGFVPEEYGAPRTFGVGVTYNF